MKKHGYLILFPVLYVSRTRPFSPDIITTSKQAMLTNDVTNLSLSLIKTGESNGWAYHLSCLTSELWKEAEEVYCPSMFMSERVPPQRLWIIYFSVQ